MSLRIQILAASMGALWAAVPASAQTALISPQNVNGLKIEDVSAEGGVIVGEFNNTVGDKEAYRWDIFGGGTFHGLGHLPANSLESKAKAISGDASAVAGEAKSLDPSDESKDVKEAFLWTAGGGMIGLGFLSDGSVKHESKATDVSYDGRVVVGESKLANPDDGKEVKGAFVWTAADGMQSLGFLSDGSVKYESKAAGVSDDGQVVVGNSKSVDPSGAKKEVKQAFVWIDGVMQGLGFLEQGDNDYESEAVAASDQGVYDPIAEQYRTYVVGTSKSTSPIDPDKSVKQAFIWTEQEGMIGLGFLSLGPGKIESKATAISRDGSVVVGESEGPDGKETFIWDEQNGMRSMRAALEADYGFDLAGWSFDKDVTFSGDGNSMIAIGTDPSGDDYVFLAMSMTPIDVPTLPAIARLLLTGGLFAAAAALLHRRGSESARTTAG